MNERAVEAVRREAFLQGYVAAVNPKTAAGTLHLLEMADRAYADWRRNRG